MLHRRTIAAMLTATFLLTFLATPAWGAKPTRPPTGSERPLTSEELAAAQRRVAAAEAYESSLAAAGTDLVSLACVTPESQIESAMTTACAPPQGFLGVEARDQVFGHYCGPAVGQVIANYSWAMGAGLNKYTQGRIAGWMLTDALGRTDAPNMEDGLELATAGSPRRPGNWDWVVLNLTDTDRDGTAADQLHSYVRSNISASRMPLAIPVKPHDKLSDFHLSSWQKPVASVGHWIAVYGWLGTWIGGDSARTYYTDSSRDEGGATGKFWDPTRHIAILIGQHTGRIVW
jgi:hypothetical protein